MRGFLYRRRGSKFRRNHSDRRRHPKSPGKKPSDWKDLVRFTTESYDDAAVEALRNGDLAECFGPFFDGIQLAESLRLPGGRMKLIHRILLLGPEGRALWAGPDPGRSRYPSG